MNWEENSRRVWRMEDKEESEVTWAFGLTRGG